MTLRFSISAAVFVLLISWSFSVHAECINGFDYATNATCTSPPSTTAPAPASTPGNGGIFTCSAPGVSSVAASSAIGGTFVPVFDAAVALNTGTQTYKACVLQVLAVQQREAQTVALVNNQWNLLSSGRNGNPYWPVQFWTDYGKARDQGFAKTYQNSLSTLHPVLANDVKRAVLRSYQATTRTPQNELACPYQGDLKAVLDGKTTDVFGGWDAMVNYPACNPYVAYIQSQNLTNAGASAAVHEWETRLNWGNGIYDSKNAQGDVVVPGVFLNAIGVQTVTSGFRQLENADDIGQMVGSFFSGLGSKLLSGPTSLASVQQYLGQAVQQQQGSLASSVVSAALTNLNQIMNWEQSYNDAQQQMASLLTDAITKLRGAESGCWQLVVQNVCESTATSTPSTGICIAKNGGATLTITTSNTFSNAAIVKGTFATLAKSLKDRIDISNQNLTTINTLITGVQSSDVTTRNTSLAQLQAIVASNALHTQTNVNQAQDELRALQAAISDTPNGLVSTSIHRWAGDDSSGGTGTIAWGGTLPPDSTNDAGWCNSNKKQTLDNWTTAWTK